MTESEMGQFNFDRESQQLIGELYNELEAEREASDTAASEAMAVIRRLQGEKAAVKMEAEQYKRLAEEKMCYAEESLSIFEDMMYQKEMEVLGLEDRVQAYKDKLISMGCNDLDLDDEKFPDTSLKTLPRKNSASLIHLSPEEQMRILDQRVKEMAGASYANTRSCTRSHTPVIVRTRSPSPFPQTSTTSSDPTKEESLELSPSLLDSKLKEIENKRGGSPGVVDVFEVPEGDQRNQRKRPAPEGFYQPDLIEETKKQSEEFYQPDLVEETKKQSIGNDEIEVDSKLAMLPPKTKPIFLPRTSYTMPCPPIIDVSFWKILKSLIKT